MTAPIIKVPIEEIKPYEKNPRHNDASVPAVMNSIKEFGFRAPIILDQDLVIIAGHTRYKAALELGLKEVPAIIADDMTPEEVEAYRIADNSAGQNSTWDYETLEEILAGLSYDMSQFGIDDDGADFNDAYGEDFCLPDGDRTSGHVMTFTLTAEQSAIIEETLAGVSGIGYEMGNDDEHGNKLTEVCSKWLASRT